MAHGDEAESTGRTGVWPVIVRGGGPTGLAQDVVIGRHRLVVDEPTTAGGANAGPDPYALILAALGACTSMTLTLYARRKGWPLDGVVVHLRHGKVHTTDCVTCETKDRLLDHIERDIELAGDLSEEQRVRLLEMAERCPVHRTLTSSVTVQTRLV